MTGVEVTDAIKMNSAFELLASISKNANIKT
ncbi:MAG: hypothetical protein JWL81_2259 [Verrucomicrobiales bacterium]|nr:hypothetical protein [Verrucomicrobiales bacterium]